MSENTTEKIQAPAAPSGEIKLPVDVMYLASYFDVTERTIQNWVKQGMPRDARGNYDLVACARWLIKDLRQKNDELQLGDETISRLKRSEMEMRNEEREIKLRRLRGEYIEVELVKSTWITLAKVITRYLEGLAVKINRRMNGDGVTLSLISDEINLIRSDIASLNPNYMIDIEENDDGTETEDNETDL